ncbi:MAG TPA: DUF4350 domain-containing protein [Pseudonocardia sp.]|jgi:hypothetical protein|nr:DUF4350 domain-containing protein [Pseudonocardia sp.]
MTSLDPGAARLWRAARVPVAIGLAVTLAALVLVLLNGRPARGLLDPASVGDEGSRAVAELLRERGVAVDVARTAAEVAAAGPAATVVIPFPWLLTDRQLDAVRGSAADLVLVAPGPEALAVLAPGVEVAGPPGEPVVRAPRCAQPDAAAAGPVTAGGEAYRAPTGTACYPGPDGAALVQVTDGGRTVTVVGMPEVFTNGELAEEGNAALALRLLGQHPRLLWYLPGPEGPEAGDERSLTELIPPGWIWGAAQLGIAAVLAAAWRARRLGPVVAEPLPVVVRAAEAVEGRGRLYRRGGAREHAAQVLRAAARARLEPLLGLGTGAEPGALVAAVAARTGRHPAEVGALLYGAAPVIIADDADLVVLAEGLDGIEREVRRS